MQFDISRMWRWPGLGGMRLLRAVYKTHSFRPHSHDYYVIGIVDNGVQRFDHHRRHYTTVPGELIVINPGEVHTGESAGRTGFSYRAIYPEVATMQRVAQDISERNVPAPEFRRAHVSAPGLFSCMQATHRGLEAIQTHDALTAETAAYQLLVYLIERFADNPPRPRPFRDAPTAVRIARDYLETHYADPVSLHDLSRECGLSRYHLARLFSRAFEMPPHRYLENVRVRHAQRLLESGSPIAEVAYATGFSSQPHLNRTFKRFIGVTPGLYRKMV